MSPPRLFEPRLLRARKRRASRFGAEAAFLHAWSAADLADRLEAIPRAFGAVLELGGGGAFSAELGKRPALAERIGAIHTADVFGGEVTVDLEALPFGEHSLDLVVSPLLLHWANDLPGVLIQMRRALRPDGLLLASLFGGETLKELRHALLTAELDLWDGAGMRISPFADLQDVAHLLQRAGYALPASDRDIVTVRYGDPLRLLSDLRAMGETSALAERAPRNLSRRVIARAAEIYRAAFTGEDGRATATFEIITATGWAPHANQQQPLPPGSAQTRLADALGTSEIKAGEKAGR